MSLKGQEQGLFLRLTVLFGNMMSESQINYLVSLEERVSDMEETLASSSENTSEMM